MKKKKKYLRAPVYWFSIKRIAALLAVVLSVFVVSVSYAQTLTPYEYIGQIHNEIMDKVLAEVEEGQALGQSKTVILASCYDAYLDASSTKLNKPESAIEAELSKVGFANSFVVKSLPAFDAMWQTVIDEINQTNRDYASKLSQILDLIETARDYSDFNSSLSAIESSSIGESYEEDLLTVSAIARSSYQYWVEGSGWDDGSKRTISRAQRLGIVRADVIGGTVGATWGAISGSFVGGIGALPGALLGGCISAAYGSALTGLSVYFGWP